MSKIKELDDRLTAVEKQLAGMKPAQKPASGKGKGKDKNK